jgi:hypothetical protein
LFIKSVTKKQRATHCSHMQVCVQSCNAAAQSAVLGSLRQKLSCITRQHRRLTLLMA